MQMTKLLNIMQFGQGQKYLINKDLKGLKGVKRSLLDSVCVTVNYSGFMPRFANSYVQFYNIYLNI